MRVVSSIFVLLAFTLSSAADETRLRRDVQDAVKAFSQAMAVDGEGSEEFVSFLHPDFTRWTHGQAVVDRTDFVRSIREWWDEGMRVSDGRSDLVGITIHDDLAIVRFERFETYVDQSGSESGSFHGFVTQLWRLDHGKWKLIVLDVAPAPEED